MRIHLTGVGGVAMGNLAAMLRESGHSVSGSDHALYPPMSDKLRDWGIDLRPFDRGNLKGVELLIVGNAISRGNVEVEEALNRRIVLSSMSAALHHFFLSGREVVVVAGTHGKTTTTFLIDHILQQSGQMPGLFVGGVRGDGHDGFRLGDSDWFVIEGDEYDTAFFDKGPKFYHYRPSHLILTSVEFDHADIYRNFSDYKLVFQRLLRWIPENGSLFAAADCRGVREVVRGYHFSPLTWYGTRCHPMLADFAVGDHYLVRTQPLIEESHSRLEVALAASGGAGSLSSFLSPLAGRHNAANALAAILVARRFGLNDEKIAAGLASFPGVMRRQQYRRDLRGDTPILFIEDFAHHPTAVRETLAGLRRAYPQRRLQLLFEPRSASSHRQRFARDYGAAFAQADSIYLCDVFNREKVPSADRFDVAALVAELQSRGHDAHFGADPAALLELWRSSWRDSLDANGAVVVAMSNGAFGGIYPAIEAEIDRHSAQR